MSIMRINEFQAYEGQGDILLNHIRSFVPMIEASDGCISCQIIQSLDDPTHIVAIEVWDSIKAHQASVKNIPPEALEKAKQLLAGAPSGEYFDLK